MEIKCPVCGMAAGYDRNGACRSCSNRLVSFADESPEAIREYLNTVVARRQQAYFEKICKETDSNSQQSIRLLHTRLGALSGVAQTAALKASLLSFHKGVILKQLRSVLIKISVLKKEAEKTAEAANAAKIKKAMDVANAAEVTKAREAEKARAQAESFPDKRIGLDYEVGIITYSNTGIDKNLAVTEGETMICKKLTSQINWSNELFARPEAKDISLRFYMKSTEGIKKIFKISIANPSSAESFWRFGAAEDSGKLVIYIKSDKEYPIRIATPILEMMA